jgi:hypothetical protein
MKRDAALLQKALEELDPVWEMAEIAEARINAYRLYRKSGETAKAHEAAAQLYQVNRGALLQNGIPLPVRLEFDVNRTDRKNRITAAFTAMLKKSGFTVQNQAAWTLFVYADENSLAAEIYETATGKSIVRKTFPSDDFSRASIARWTRDIATMAFTME